MLKVKVKGAVVGEPLQEMVLDKLCLTVEDTAQVLSLGRTNVYALLKSKQIASVKICGRRLVPLVSLRDFVTAQMQAAS